MESAGFLPSFFFGRHKNLSYYGNVGSADFAAVLRIAFGIESNLLALFERLEALSVDGGEMYKYFLSGGIIGDESVTFLCIKPFYCTVIHFGTSFINITFAHRSRVAVPIMCNIICNSKVQAKKSHIFVNHH